MSLTSVGPLPRRPVTPAVIRPVAVPAGAPTRPAPPPPAPAGGGFLADARDWLLTPYRALAGKYGVEYFVRPNAHTPEGDPPSQWGLKYETLDFKSQDGTPLKGWYMPAAKPTDKTLVLAHGHGGNMSDVLWRWAPWLHKAGYNLLAFDFRNAGGSGGNHTTMGLEEKGDLSAALDQAQAKGAKRIAVMGLSLGAATALTVAGDDERVEAVVADCPFDTLENAVSARVARHEFDLGPFKGLTFPLQRQVTRGVIEAAERMTGHGTSKQDRLGATDPRRAMPKLADRPVFFIHGQADDETLPGNSVALAKAHPGAELWLVPGAKHGGSYKAARDAYKAKVLDFLARKF